MVQVTTDNGLTLIINLALLSWIEPKSRIFQMAPAGSYVLSVESYAMLEARGYLPYIPKEKK